MRAYIEQAIRNVQARKEQKLRDARQAVMQDKILPYNRDIDEARDKAIQQLTLQYNEDVQKLQREFDEKKNSIILDGEEHKKKNEETVLMAETAAITAECDDIIRDLENTLSKIKE